MTRVDKYCTKVVPEAIQIEEYPENLNKKNGFHQSNIWGRVIKNYEVEIYG